MTERISERDLEAVCRRINRMTGNEEAAYNTAGAFYIDGDYGGWDLYRYTGDHGSVDDVFRCGHVPARDLYNRMQAFLDGMAVTEDA